MIAHRLKTALLAATALALFACGKKEEAAPAAPSTPEATAPATPTEAAPDFAAIAAAAVADPRRPEADRADDERRKAAEALAFMQLRPGMTVFEIEAGAGWYTELLSHAVGADGAVIMQNPEGFLSFVGDKVAERLKEGRLANVRQSVSNFDALDAPDGSVDLVTWVQGPHELYYKPNGSSLGDPTKAYAEIARILKPGAAFVVIDHSAESGAPESVGDTLHRVDEAIVKRMAAEAGLSLAAESDFLANPQDTLTVGVFDPTIRGHTDQFALRFRKEHAASRTRDANYRPDADYAPKASDTPDANAPHDPLEEDPTEPGRR
jgi:predicted methyltransferase